MARKPPARRKKKAAPRKAAVRRKATARNKTKTARRKPASRKRTVRTRSDARRPRKIARKSARGRSRRKPGPRRASRPSASLGAGASRRGGLGPEAGGQSGDIEGLPRQAVADSESVEELVEEGQAFEAGIVDAVENVPDADQGPIRTREVPEDDVPEEYLDED